MKAVAASTALLLLAAGCSSAPERPAESADTKPRVATGSAPTTADSSGCPVTMPRELPALTGAQPPQSPGSFFGRESAFGNGLLWVGGLGPEGRIPAQRFIEPDGSISWKYGWWRATSGKLRVTGRRLDAAAPPLSATIPDGYGDSGFQSSGVRFPTRGCWQVTGRVGDVSLTFVTAVA